MIQIGICDDDEELAVQLRKMLLNMEKSIGEKLTIDVYTSGKSMYDRLKEKSIVFDLIFLDISMPQMDGIDIGNKIREELDDNITQIVYISSQTNYAMQLFHIRPFDFLVKPFDQQQVEAIMKSLKKAFYHKKKRFSIVTGRSKEIINIPYTNILYFQSNARKILIHTRDGIYEFYGRMNDVFEEVGHAGFLYIHKSYIVNYSQINRMKYEYVCMSDGTELTISPSKRKEIRETYMQFEKATER